MRLVVPDKVPAWNTMLRRDDGPHSFSHFDLDELAGVHLDLADAIAIRPYLVTSMIDGSAGDDPLGRVIRRVTAKAAAPDLLIRSSRGSIEQAINEPQTMHGLNALSGDLTRFGMGLAIRIGE